MSWAVLGVSAVLSFALCGTSARAGMPIYRVAGTGDAVPGGGGTFATFGAPVNVSRQAGFGFPSIYAFEATRADGVKGVYYYTYNLPLYGGGLIRSGVVADTTMAAPSGGGNYAGFGHVSGGYGEVGFVGTDAGGTEGVYVQGQLTPLTLIATEHTTVVPGVPVGHVRGLCAFSFSEFGWAGGDFVSDTGSYVFNPYADDGSLQLTLRGRPISSIIPPGASGPVTFLGRPSLKAPQRGPSSSGYKNGFSAIRAVAGGVEAVYRNLTDPPLAKAGDPTPDGTGHFTRFGDPAATTNRVSFTAWYEPGGGGAERQAVFTFGPYQNGFDPFGTKLRQTFTTGEAAPDSGGATFAEFLEVADASFGMTLLARLSDGVTGLFSNAEGFARLLATGELLDGKRVVGIGLSPDGDSYYNGRTFRVEFEDGTEGVYYSEVPEPAGSGVVVAVLLLSLRRLR